MNNDNLRVLIGWKEIASYLNCSISTASRRIVDGLPVFRVGGGIRAFADDIDHWLEGERLRKLEDRSSEPAELPGIVVGEENLVDTVTAMRNGKKGHRYAVIPLGVDSSEYERIEGRLASAEEKYRWVLETVPVWIWEIGSSGEYSYSNAAVFDILGYRPEELLGFRPDEFLLASEEIERCRDRMESLRTERKVIRDYRCRFIHRDGDERWLEADAEPVYDASGEFAGIRGVSRDVTERVRAEEKEKEHVRSLSFLSATAMDFVEYPLERDLFGYIAEKLVDLTSEAIVIIASYDEISDRFRLEVIEGLGDKAGAVAELLGEDPLGATFRVTARVKEHFRSGKLHKIGADVSGLTDGAVSRKVGRKIQAALGFEDLYVMGITKYGSLLGAAAILTRSGGALANAGVVEAFVCQASVAVQKKKAEDSLLRAAEEWRRTFDAVPDVVFLVDNEHRIIRANRAAADRFGRTWDKLIGQKCFRVVHRRKKPAADCPLARLFATGEEQRHEEIYSPLVDAYFDFTFAPVTEERGKAVAAVMVGRDVTERRRACRLAEVQRDLAYALAGAVDLDEAARLCVRAAISASGMEAGGLYVVDKGTGALELVHAEGFSASFVQSASRFEAAFPNAGSVRAGDPVYANFADLGTPAAGLSRRERLRAVAVLPVKFEGEVVAYLNVASCTQDDVSTWTRRVLEGIAVQIGGVIARTKRRASSIEASLTCENNTVH